MIRGARAERALILRAFRELPGAEQRRFPNLVPIADSLVARIARLARRLGVLEEQLKTEKARGPTLSHRHQEGADGQGTDTPRRTRTTDEVAAAVEKTATLLRESDDALKDLREILSGAGGVLTETVQSHLAAAIARARALDEEG